MNRIIECEIRAELLKNDLPSIHKKLESGSIRSDRTRRLSAMFFGKTSLSKPIDVRIRVTNGTSELVIKKGELHAHDRIEISQPILNDQFLGLIKIFALMDFTDIRIGERQTTNYLFKGDITASVVEAGSIAYLEVEKMCNSKKEANLINADLLKFLDQVPCKVIKSRKAFDDLCARLSVKEDWDFKSPQDQFKRLAKIFDGYKKRR